MRWLETHTQLLSPVTLRPCVCQAPAQVPRLRVASGGGVGTRPTWSCKHWLRETLGTLGGTTGHTVACTKLMLALSITLLAFNLQNK